MSNDAARGLARVSTWVPEPLYKAIRVLCVRKGRQFNKMVEEALLDLAKKYNVDVDAEKEE